MKHIRFIETYRGQTPKVDREAFLIRGVKFLGWDSGNGREYAKPDPKIFEGAKSRVNHFMQEGDPNPPDPKMESIWAYVESAEVRDDGVFGTLKYNPKHSMIEQILWWAENNPKVAGFSPIMFGERKIIGGREVRTPLMVESVDLVDSPATTGGFFESKQEKNDMDLTQALAKIAEMEREKAQLTTTNGELTRSLEAEKAAHAATKGSLATFTESARKLTVDASRTKLVKDTLGDDVDAAFVEAVKAAPSDEAAKAMCEAVKARSGTPVSSGTTPAAAMGNGKATKFIESIKDPAAEQFLNYKTRS